MGRGYSNAASTKLRVTTNQRIRPGASPKVARLVTDCLKGLTKQQQQAAFRQEDEPPDLEQPTPTAVAERFEKAADFRISAAAAAA